MLCGCLSSRKQHETETLTPLDSPADRPASCAVANTKRSTPNRKVLAFPVPGAKGPNFDFIPNDSGDHYIATFRAKIRDEIMGCDSKPIPKAVFDNFRIIKKRKSGQTYCIDIDTGGADLFQYFRTIDEETARRLGVVLK